jgi:PST family polysaccharide transporter
MTLPITIACALFADDLVFVLLGRKWTDAAPIFRLLAPTILAFAIVNPLGWLISALGLAARGVRMAFVLAPVLIGGYLLGNSYGPKGVAFAYSLVMSLWIVPAIAWAVRGTPLSAREVLLTAVKPLASGLAAAAIAFGASLLAAGLPPLVRLTIETAVLLLAYGGFLLFVAGQKAQYLDLLRGLRRRSAEPVLAPT